MSTSRYHSQYAATAVAVIAAAFLTISCNRSAQTSQRLDEVRQSGSDFLRDLGRYGYSQKEDFIAAMRKERARIDQDMADLAAKADRATASVKAEAQPKLEALREQSARLQQKIDDAAHASEPAWEDFKQDVRQTIEKSDQNLDETRRWLSEKIAP